MKRRRIRTPLPFSAHQSLTVQVCRQCAGDVPEAVGERLLLFPKKAEFPVRAAAVISYGPL